MLTINKFAYKINILWELVCSPDNKSFSLVSQVHVWNEAIEKWVIHLCTLIVLVTFCNIVSYRISNFFTFYLSGMAFSCYLHKAVKNTTLQTQFSQFSKLTALLTGIFRGSFTLQFFSTQFTLTLILYPEAAAVRLQCITETVWLLRLTATVTHTKTITVCCLAANHKSCPHSSHTKWVESHFSSPATSTHLTCKSCVCVCLLYCIKYWPSNSSGFVLLTLPLFQDLLCLFIF